MKPHLRITIETLLASDTSQHEIARRTGIARKTIRRYARAIAAAKVSGVATGCVVLAEQTPPPRPPGMAVPPTAAQPGSGIATSACEPHRASIEAQVALGRHAVSIYQELVDTHDFHHKYNSVKRFVDAAGARAGTL